GIMPRAFPLKLLCSIRIPRLPAHPYETETQAKKCRKAGRLLTFVGMISRHRIAGWPSCTFLSTQARWKQYMRSSQSADAPRRTALVLSGGGMFGAYQAGVWAALHHSIQLDMVVGASIGCLNGWLIAGGCSG